MGELEPSTADSEDGSWRSSVSCREIFRFFCRDVMKVLVLFPSGNKTGGRRVEGNEEIRVVDAW